MSGNDDLAASAPAHVAVAVMLAQRRVLLVHRTATREHYPDAWSLPGGHLEPDEAPKEAVIREVHEELGVTIADVRPFALQVDAPGVVMHAFLVTSWGGALVNRAPEEHDDLRWFAPEELSTVTLAHPESLAGILDAMAAHDD